MKTYKTFLSVLVALTVVFTTATVNSYANKLNKTFKQEFKADKESIVKINNRFGQVSIENWENNSVLIEVEVTIEHPSRDRAERMLSAISITLEQVGKEIRGITQIDDKLIRSVSNINFGSSSKEIRIDYKVKMPKHLNVNLTNKYGDIFIDELTGHSKIDLKYGNLKANRIIYGSSDPLAMLTLGYGNASIDEVDWMRFDIKYANVDIVKSKALVVLSKYSKISVDMASSMVVDSKYDTYTIGTIANLVGDSGYTTYRLKKLDKKLDVRTRYGDVRIEDVANTFESITFEGSYASLYAPIASSVSYQFDGEASYGGLNYNTPARVNRIESSNKLSVNGRVGERENPNAMVKVRVRYGSARLR